MYVFKNNIWVQNIRILFNLSPPKAPQNNFSLCHSARGWLDILYNCKSPINILTTSLILNNPPPNFCKKILVLTLVIRFWLSWHHLKSAPQTSVKHYWIRNPYTMMHVHQIG